MVRETWTDERLDDLTNRVDEGFRESREDLRQFRHEVNARFERIDERFDSLQRLLLGGMLTVILTVLLTRL